MKKNGFIDGAIIATLAILISKVLGLLYVVPFYSIIGEKGGALYGYAYNIYNFFLIISSAGIPLAISKITSEYITKNENEKKEKMFYIAKIAIRLFSIGSFAICFILAKGLAHLIIGNISGGNSIEDVTLVIRCISFALLIVPVLSISRGYLQGHKYIAASSISQVIEQIVRISFILIGSFIAYKVLNLPLAVAVGISVFSAAIGAIVAYIYLYFKTKTSLNPSNNFHKKINKNETKELVSKIISYSLPFIIVNIVSSLYNTTDMILMMRGLAHLGYSGADAEVISSVFTTWGDKLSNIVRAIATGLTISLIPSLVSAYVSKDLNTVNNYFNKVLQVLLYVIFPITVFMSIFTPEIWNVFYGYSYYGPIVYRFLVLVVVLDSGYILIGSTLQGLYKTKLIYFSVITGLFINLLLDLPLMFLFNKIGFYPFYGAIVSTIIGYAIALGIPLYRLAQKDNFNYKSTISGLGKLIISNIILVLICTSYKKIIAPPDSRIFSIFYLGVIAVISFSIYLYINRKMILELLEVRLNKKLTKK